MENHITCQANGKHIPCHTDSLYLKLNDNQKMKFNTIRIYYLTTPVFFILHTYLGLNLRVSIPGAQDYWTYLYYLICFIAGFVVFKSVMAGALFSLVESSANILLLLLSVWLPVINVGGNPIANSGIHFGAPELIHFIIAGAILLLSFYSNPIITKKA